MNESRRKVLAAFGGIAALTGCIEKSKDMSEDTSDIDPDKLPPNPENSTNFDVTTSELLYHIALNVQMIREELEE